MPLGLRRFQHSGQSHFVTFCCYHRRRLLTTDPSRHIFETALERVRKSFKVQVYGYVVMPEHVHLLLSEPQCDADCVASARDSTKPTSGPFKPSSGSSGHLPTGGPFKPSFGLSGREGGTNPGEIKQSTLADALKSLKQGVSRRVIGGAEHFWQKIYYDFNIRNNAQFMEKLRYIHRNPLKGGLCDRPEDWDWSSFRHYATGYEGRVEIESEWTARERERASGKLCAAEELLPHSSQKTA